MSPPRRYSRAVLYRCLNVTGPDLVNVDSSVRIIHRPRRLSGRESTTTGFKSRFALIVGALIMRAPQYGSRGVPMPKLNQIVAIEKSVKSRVYGEITEMHKLSQKPDLFSGFSKQYRKKDEEGEDYPPEQKR